MFLFAIHLIMATKCTVLIAQHRHLFTLTFVHSSNHHSAVRVGVQMRQQRIVTTIPIRVKKNTFQLWFLLGFYYHYLFLSETRSHYITQAGLDLMILLPRPPGYQDYKMHYHILFLICCIQISWSNYYVPSCLPILFIIRAVFQIIRYYPHCADNEIELQNLSVQDHM